MHKTCHVVFFVPSVTDTNWYVCAIQESPRVLIFYLNNKINVHIEIVASLAMIL